MTGGASFYGLLLDHPGLVWLVFVRFFLYFTLTNDDERVLAPRAKIAAPMFTHGRSISWALTKWEGVPSGLF